MDGCGLSAISFSCFPKPLVTLFRSPPNLFPPTRTMQRVDHRLSSPLVGPGPRACIHQSASRAWLPWSMSLNGIVPHSATPCALSVREVGMERGGLIKRKAPPSPNAQPVQPGGAASFDPGRSLQDCMKTENRRTQQTRISRLGKAFLLMLSWFKLSLTPARRRIRALGGTLHSPSRESSKRKGLAVAVGFRGETPAQPRPSQ